MTTINDVWSAYDEATGHWTGCSWPTRYGSLGLNLNSFPLAKPTATQTAGSRLWRTR
jgi:hypothetical protein